MLPKRSRPSPTSSDDPKAKQARQNAAYYAMTRWRNKKAVVDQEYDIPNINAADAQTALGSDLYMMHRIKVEAREPVLRSNTLRDLAKCLYNKSGTEVSALVAHDKLAVKYDIVDVDEAGALAQVHEILAKQPFDIIRLPSSLNLDGAHGWTLIEQVRSLGHSKSEAVISAVQPARDSVNGSTTHSVTVAEMMQLFDQPANIPPGFASSNFLDIKNNSGIQFGHNIIYPSSLLFKIHQKKVHAAQQDASRTATQVDYDPKDQWMILTYGPAFSPFHVDHAGYNTLVYCVEGVKVWTVPAGDWEVNSRLMSLRGTTSTAYPEGIVSVPLHRGDFLIQAPGTIHAVSTVQNACFAGFFFYLATNFSRSIRAVRRTLNGDLISNDDIKAQDYTNLTCVVEYLDDEELFTASQRAACFVEILDLLQGLRWLSIKDHALTHTSRRYTPKKTNPTPQEVFLNACVVWVKAYNGRVESADNESGAWASSL